MTAITFADADALGAVMTALPLAIASQCTAVQNRDGSFTLNAPAELAATISAINPATAVAASLAAYAWEKQAVIAAGGVTINLGSSGSPINISVDTTALGRADLGGLVASAQVNQGSSETWYQSSGNVTLTAAQIVALGQAVAVWISSTYAAASAVAAAVSASPPTITTTAEIDAFAWPANS